MKTNNLQKIAGNFETKDCIRQTLMHGRFIRPHPGANNPKNKYHEDSDQSQGPESSKADQDQPQPRRKERHCCARRRHCLRCGLGNLWQAGPKGRRSPQPGARTGSGPKDQPRDNRDAIRPVARLQRHHWPHCRPQGTKATQGPQGQDRSQGPGQVRQVEASRAKSTDRASRTGCTRSFVSVTSFRSRLPAP